MTSRRDTGRSARRRGQATPPASAGRFHLTETCDEDRPRLVVHADTTAGDVHEAVRAEPILAALDAKGLSAGEHLADAAYLSAELLVGAEDRYGVRLVGPPRKDVSWQARIEGGYTTDRFALDWGREVATCPEGEESQDVAELHRPRPWRVRRGRVRPGGLSGLRSPGLSASDRRAARGRSGSTQSGNRTRWRRCGRNWRQTRGGLGMRRAGVEGTLSQGVRAMGLRRSRYRGLDKTRLSHVATAAALWPIGRRRGSGSAPGPDSRLTLCRAGGVSDFASSIPWF